MEGRRKRYFRLKSGILVSRTDRVGRYIAAKGLVYMSEIVDGERKFKYFTLPEIIELNEACIKRRVATI